MSESFSLRVDEMTGLLHVSGELTFATVNDILEPAQTLFESIGELNIDLTGVTRSDSAGLAVLIDWMRTAKTSNKKIVFYNVPAQILEIANASGLDELLPMQQA